MRKEINKVFTPRNHEVNNTMYINRNMLESDLSKAVDGSLNPVICGESGNGKSWLYKKVFSEKKIDYYIVNSAKAAILKSLIKEIVSVVFPNGYSYTSSVSSETNVGVNGLILKGEETITVQIEKSELDQLEKVYSHIASERPNNEYSFIVIENIESLFKNSDLMSELGNLLLLLDDPRYAKYKVKYLLVGTPLDIVEYYRKLDNYDSIGNRLIEISKVGSIEIHLLKKFLQKGFITELEIPLTESELTYLSEYIYYITLGVAQRIQEYCEQLAYLVKENNWKYNRSLLKECDSHWMRIGLRKSYAVIESVQNSIKSTVGRRNQVIYCIGRIIAHPFTVKDIEFKMSEEFIIRTEFKSLNIGSILKKLAEMENPIIRSVNNKKRYEIVDSRYLMIIRLIYKKDDEDNIVIRKFQI